MMLQNAAPLPEGPIGDVPDRQSRSFRYRGQMTTPQSDIRYFARNGVPYTLSQNDQGEPCVFCCAYHPPRKLGGACKLPYWGEISRAEFLELEQAFVSAEMSERAPRRPLRRLRRLTQIFKLKVSAGGRS